SCSPEEAPAPPGQDHQHQERLGEVLRARGVAVDEALDLAAVDESVERPLVDEHSLRFAPGRCAELVTAADGESFLRAREDRRRDRLAKRAAQEDLADAA